MQKTFEFLKKIFYLGLVLIMLEFVAAVIYVGAEAYLTDPAPLWKKTAIAIPVIAVFYWICRKYVFPMCLGAWYLLLELKALAGAFRWREVRRKDLIASILAIGAIATTEFLSPSLAVTGKPNAIELPQFSVSPEKMVWVMKR